jgi:hypothetical protein
VGNIVLRTGVHNPRRRDFAPKGAHTRMSLASDSGWARVPVSQTRPCMECHEPDFGRVYGVYTKEWCSFKR